MGHIRDLPKTLLGVDIEHGFKPRYVDIPGKTALIRQLRSDAAASDGVILATDPDREGGRLFPWHLAQLLKVDLDGDNRVTFNEITKSGVQQGMAHPRRLDMDLVNAQQARRILDRIVGYKLSPFLWKKDTQGPVRRPGAVRRGTHHRGPGGRDPRFISEEYWTLDALLADGEKGKTFPARFHGTKEGKLKNRK